MQIRSPRKLIEVALPLDDINEAATREKSIRHGHPSTLHLWWARRPLAAARAVLFAQLVNDPGYETGRGFTRGVNKKDAARERERLFGIIRDLVKWENTNNEDVLKVAREEIHKSWRETCKINEKNPQASEIFDPEVLPAFHDPFAGGGAIPLEAQRLGLEAHASDLNPVAVLINKAMIEIPPRFAGRKPVGPIPVGEKQAQLHEDWSGARGLAEDVRRYGRWMREQAENRIGSLYPKIRVTPEMAQDREDLKPLVGQQLTAIAYLWARTVRSPNPAYAGTEVPLASTFLISTKPGNEAWIEPVTKGREYSFHVRSAVGGLKPPPAAKAGTKAAGRGSNFLCIVSGSPISGDYIKAEGQAARMGQRLMAVVVEGKRGRIYLSPNEEMEAIAKSARPKWRPVGAVPERLTGGTCYSYGLTSWGDLFTDRQLAALTTFSELVGEARERIRDDALRAGMTDDGRGLDAGGTGALAYSEAVATYLVFAVDKVADRNSSICGWAALREHARNTFGRQAIPMVWDFAESNPLSDSSGNFEGGIESISKGLLSVATTVPGHAEQSDAQSTSVGLGKVVSTDPPYYDNIGYADLSDFFYVWMRAGLRNTYPALFSTLAVPKAEELVATAHRHGGKEEAERFFLEGMTAAMHNIAEKANPAFPVTIYYAFKQAETKDAGTASTGWQTFIAAVVRAGFVLTGTWPMRTELDRRMVGQGANALASSIILVCRRRSVDAPSISRKDFIRELKSELSEAIEAMLGGEGGASPIAPVDLAQAAIGPGMSVFSRYCAVLEANGDPMSVHTALTLINKQVDEVLGGENFDAETNFCLGWFQEVGWSTGEFGIANTLAQAKATSVASVEQSGVIRAQGGKVKLLKPAEYAANWDPKTDNRTPVWEALHQLIRALDQGGESDAGALLSRMPELSGDIRRLSFWLYTLCERAGWAEDARRYNELVTAWHAIEASSHDAGRIGSQTTLDV